MAVVGYFCGISANNSSYLAIGEGRDGSRVLGS